MPKVTEASQVSQELQQEMTQTLLVPVTVINVSGPAALVEWKAETGLRRATVPADALQDGGVAPETLDLGIAYGLPWETLITLSATSQQLAEELRKAGIWTESDLTAHAQAAFGALQAAYAVDLAALFRAAAKHKEL